MSAGDDAPEAATGTGTPSPDATAEREAADGSLSHPPPDLDPDLDPAPPPPTTSSRDLPPLLRARLAKRGILPAEQAEASAPPPPSAHPLLVWQPAPPAAVADIAAGPPLPPGWGCAFDWAYRLPYFYNPWTGVRTWNHPLGMMVAAAGGGGYHHHAPALLLPPFDPSATFTGARPGWAFKMGGRGLGYYRDGEDDGEGGRGHHHHPPAAPPPSLAPVPDHHAHHRGGARGRGGPPPHQPPPPPPPPAGSVDPMDPSAYSDAPRGGWGSGLEKARKG